MSRYGFEVMTADGWSADAAGVQDDSNLFYSRAEAEAEVAALAHVLGIPAADIRVVKMAR